MRSSEKFRVEKYSEFDAPAREAVRRWMDASGIYTLSVEDYGADIKAIRPMEDGTCRKSLHELEVRPCWEGGRFPYETVTIPHRKGKLLDKGDDLYFWSLSRDFRLGMFVPGEVVKQCQQVTKNTDRGVGTFFSVPCQAYTIIELGRSECDT